MTIADKIAALPPLKPTRLALLLETVRAMYDAEDANEKHFALDKERDAQWDFDRHFLYRAMMDADADLRTLQAHLEGERA